MENGPGSKKKHLDGLSGSGFMLKIILGEILKNTKMRLISPFPPMQVDLFGCFGVWLLLWGLG